MSGPAVDVSGLRAAFRGREVVHGVSFSIEPGETVALVGESGSGKSVTARSLMGLAGSGASVTADRLSVGGLSVPALSSRQLRRLRGATVGMIAQDAYASLDPLRPVGREIEDALRLHTDLSSSQRRARVLALLSRVGVPEPALRAAQRPHELSGGLRQRALIAAAIAADPAVLIADEPTTALDATVQAGILDLLASLAADGAAVLLISHDLAVVSRLASRVLVMRDGSVLEQGPTRAVISAPAHPYTRALVAAVPTDRPRGTPLAPAPLPAPFPSPVPSAASTASTAHLLRDPAVDGVRSEHSTGGDALRAGDSAADGVRSEQSTSAESTRGLRGDAEGEHSTGEGVLEARGVTVRFAVGDGRMLRAVSDVSLRVEAGRTLGLVGESGSGKTTLARVLLGLQRPDEGTVTLAGQQWVPAAERDRRPRRALIASVPQDPYGTLDPRWIVRRTLADALGTAPRGNSGEDAVAALLDRVRLPRALAERRPQNLSPGQRQRVAIARAIARRPRVLVADEPVSSLDVSVQAQILDLIDDLQRELGLAVVLVSHDLGVIRHSSDDVVVLRAGEVVEHGPTERVFDDPQAAYTRRLVSAAPRLSL
ncbi:ABC transporter ATP-binding protein [Humibacter sp. BT305]|nr:ABC transporter ATP-binding protein [Humibacter sp. BT305]